MTYESVLQFWFKETPYEKCFSVDPQFDREIEQRFGALWKEVCDGGHAEWAKTPHGALALVIVLDQFSRNICRGTAEAFAQDARALSLAEMVIAGGDDNALIDRERAFLYMPFEHAEDLEMQNRSVDLFAAIGDEQSLEYAKRHRDVIQRFGRFPHRNEILGRASTPEEVAFLKTPGSSF